MSEHSPHDPLTMLQGLASDEPMPDGAEDRVRARLAASLAGTVAVAGASAGAAAVWAKRGWVWYFARWSLPAAVAGAMAGAAGYAVIAPAKVRTVYVASPSSEARAQPLAPALAAPIVPPTAPAASVAESERAVPRGAASHPMMDGVSALNRERGILDGARAQIAAGNPAAALRLLDQHASGFPRGTLAEEREAMAINALVALGRRAEAQRRGTAFRERFPRSLVLPSVEAALATLAGDGGRP